MLGHPRWENNCTFNSLVKLKGWKKVIVIHPFCPQDLQSYSHLLKYCILADRFIAITGRYWGKETGRSFFSEWTKKFLQIDLAVDSKNFPKVKGSFNAPGKRKFIFIGNHTHYKNVSFLNQIAEQLQEIEFHRFGPYSKKFPNLIQHGTHELNSTYAKNLIKKMDFMITMGNRDANPTTILESSAMGLVAVCPVGSGYTESDGVFNISGTDFNSAIQKINYLNKCNAVSLEKKRTQMRALIDNYYCWPRFVRQIVSEIKNKGVYDYKIRNVWSSSVIYLFYFILGRKAPWKITVKSCLKKFKKLLNIF